MSETKQKLSADDCDMLRSFANNGDAAGLIAFIEERYGQAVSEQATVAEAKPEKKKKD